MFEKLSEKPVAEVQKEQVAEWNEENLLKKCVDAREGNPQFVFYEGPPTANGKPGIHHVMARTLKDSINRYKTMQGFQVNRKAGWDTHGLPVEIEVEKQLGINGKQEIEEYGIRQFNKKCRESVFTYTGLWRDMSERMGYMADMDDPYITLDNKYIETEWWIVKKFFDEDMIYEGHKILPYCPRCGTGLASHEVAQGYKDVKVNTLTVKFKKTGALIGAMVVDKDDEVLLINSEGIIIRIRANEISELGRATQGVKIMKVQDETKIVAMAKVIKGEDETSEDKSGEQIKL